MVENTSLGSSKNIAPSMESGTRRQFLVHHSTTIHVVERMNQTIVEKVRCMLKLAKLPKSFGVKLLTLRYTLSIDRHQFLWTLIFLKEFGQEKMFHTLT